MQWLKDCHSFEIFVCGAEFKERSTMENFVKSSPGFRAY